MRIGFLHTAEAHVATFDALLPPGSTAFHVVRPDLLVRAQTDGLDSVRDETLAVIATLGAADAVICSCSTLGPLAELAGSGGAIRIDRPMMEAACAYGQRIALAICLESTRDASLALLESCAPGPIITQVIHCNAAWPLFVAGETAAFALLIAQIIKSELPKDTDCIVLAQASMAPAAAHLQDLGVPVLCSPELAVKRAVSRASEKG